MNIYRDINEVKKDKNTVISVGTFDGVHRAHRQIIQKVTDITNDNNASSLIITFDPHPQEVLKTRTPDIKQLTTTEEKLRLFESLGIENVLVIRFTMEFSKTTARDFYEKLIYGKIGISDLVVGYDHGFGKDREGNLKMLDRLGKELGFSIHRVEEIDVDGAPVSSTRIRKFLSDGEIENANSLLGYDYSFEGIVVEGDKQGRSLGFPTANIKPVAENKAMPKDGVYTVRIGINGSTYYGMMNIGYRPTLTEGVRKLIEVNIFDFDGSIYGEKINISFLKRLRDERKFSSRDELIEQLHNDKEASLSFLNEHFKQPKNN
jgi:riboflavin kinase/FMN adenylyltransferase